MYSGWAMQLWLTQLNQAEGYKHEIEHFRRIRTDCSEKVAGCNMGRMVRGTLRAQLQCCSVVDAKM
jgi:hypothetical protein